MSKTAMSSVGDGRPSCSASTIVSSTASGYHLLKIDGYSCTKDVPNGDCIKSRSFSIGGGTWHIEYYPNGILSEDADHISLLLCLEDDVADAVKAQFKFSLLDQAGKPVPSHSHNSEVRGFPKEGWGYQQLIKREALEESGHLKDDGFTVRCDVTVINEFHTEDAKAATPFVLVPPSDLQQHLDGLLSAGEGADVTFNVGGETIAAHRCLLAARSPVFKAELFGAMKESTTTNAIRIDDMEAQVFKALLYFIYTDSLYEMTEEDVSFQHLLVAADRYNLPRLKLICENKLCEYIDVNSAATILALAEQHHCRGLKEACMEFLSSPTNLKAVMATDGFEHLATSCVSLVKELIAKLITTCHQQLQGNVCGFYVCHHMKEITDTTMNDPERVDFNESTYDLDKLIEIRRSLSQFLLAKVINKTREFHPSYGDN